MDNNTKTDICSDSTQCFSGDKLVSDKFYPFYDGFECEDGHLNTDFPILQYSNGTSLNIRFKGKPIDCVMNEWGEWGDCDKPCGGGKRTRQRTVKIMSKNGGLACGPLAEDQVCNS
jgi:hypothetical protein